MLAVSWLSFALTTRGRRGGCPDCQICLDLNGAFAVEHAEPRTPRRHLLRSAQIRAKEQATTWQSACRKAPNDCSYVKSETLHIYADTIRAQGSH